MEMRQRIMRSMSRGWRAACIIVLVMLVTGMEGIAQDPLKIYTIKDSKMHIILGKKLPEAEIDNFISQFDLDHLALKRFIKSGFTDSIVKHGWTIGMNNSVGFMITKPMMGADINDPAGRIVFTGEYPSPDSEFPSVSSNVRFGYNRFRNKNFLIRDSMVQFFLRENLNARRVMLAGSFNKWDPEATPMTKTDSGWIAWVKLAPGKYWYKFVIDGNWTVDTDNRTNENDGKGNTNSVYYFTNRLFRLTGYDNAKRVILAGSFNDWKERELAMVKTNEGWELPLYLAEGTHTYRFIVDKTWMADPQNGIRFPNEHNDFNSVVNVGKRYEFNLEGYQSAKKVILSGSFNGWRDYELLMVRTANGWQLPYVLGPGNYEYKFIVDGNAIADPANPPAVTGNNTSTLVLEPNYTFRLKGFETAKKIFLAGDFNGWSPNSLPMKLENGEWIFTAHLSPGKHLYKFVVDGKWILDPGNKLWEQNEHNTGNSVLWIEK